MRIESVNSMNTRMPTRTAQGMDSTSKNIQKQIQNKQEEMKELSESEGMSPEEKMKKRQEIQQQIADLNTQLRQHQIEQRKEQQSKGSPMEHMLGGKTEGSSKSQNGQSAGLSQASMKAMISADTSIKQSKVQGNVATQMEGRAGVLEIEIKQDARRGNTAAKEKELAQVEQAAKNATASQMSTLNDANEAMEEARVAEKESNKEESIKKTATKKGDGNQEKTGNVDKSEESGTSTLETLFTEHNSFASNVSQKGDSIAPETSRNKGTYTSNGTYSNTLSSLVSNKIDEEV